ncbi:beta-carotene ketolase, partial [Oscillatoriales cyanobacterium LEGE 11467]|nr:beta-carotene ketolase [Zarconia navalis LEGE 11467]
MPNTIASMEAQLQTHRDSILGIFSASVILTLWVGSLVWLLPADLSNFPIWGIAAIFLVRMFLHTGLFITPHDAMHGTICPTLPRIN